MSYIAFELDALNVAPAVARSASVSEEVIIAGLLRMWAWCFREKTDTITADQLRGHFGADVAPALVAFRFLEAAGESWRVRGAERYLRISEARSKGGKAASGNLKRGAAKPEVQPEPQPEVSPGSSPAPAGSQPGGSPGSTPALTPSTEHRAPNTRKEEAPPPEEPAVAAFHIEPPDIGAIDSWSKEDFWKAAELTRRKWGFPPQKWPNPITLSKWWGEARAEAEVRELALAFQDFAKAKHWREAKPPAPFAGFMSQWNNFLPRRAS